MSTTVNKIVFSQFRINITNMTGSATQLNTNNEVEHYVACLNKSSTYVRLDGINTDFFFFASQVHNASDSRLFLTVGHLGRKLT